MPLTNLILTAYCSCHLCCGEWSIGAHQRTASGTIPKEGRTIACNFLPFGTRIRIQGFSNTFVVEDRLHPKYTNRVDIFFSTHRKALKFGIKKGVIYEQNVISSSFNHKTQGSIKYHNGGTSSSTQGSGYPRGKGKGVAPK